MDANSGGDQKESFNFDFDDSNYQENHNTEGFPGETEETLTNEQMGELGSSNGNNPTATDQVNHLPMTEAGVSRNSSNQVNTDQREAGNATNLPLLQSGIPSFNASSVGLPKPYVPRREHLENGILPGGASASLMLPPYSSLDDNLFGNPANLGQPRSSANFTSPVSNLPQTLAPTSTMVQTQFSQGNDMDWTSDINHDAQTQNSILNLDDLLLAQRMNGGQLLGHCNTNNNMTNPAFTQTSATGLGTLNGRSAWTSQNLPRLPYQTDNSSHLGNGFLTPSGPRCNQFTSGKAFDSLPPPSPSLSSRSQHHTVNNTSREYYNNSLLLGPSLSPSRSSQGFPHSPYYSGTSELFSPLQYSNSVLPRTSGMNSRFYRIYNPRLNEVQGLQPLPYVIDQQIPDPRQQTEPLLPPGFAHFSNNQQFRASSSRSRNLNDLQLGQHESGSFIPPAGFSFFSFGIETQSVPEQVSQATPRTLALVDPRQDNVTLPLMSNSSSPSMPQANHANVCLNTVGAELVNNNSKPSQIFNPATGEDIMSDSNAAQRELEPTLDNGKGGIAEPFNPITGPLEIGEGSSSSSSAKRPRTESTSDDQEGSQERATLFVGPLPPIVIGPDNRPRFNVNYDFSQFSVYDPMYEELGLPVDPHLRMFALYY